ncbi:MAG TPA: hypothetical protein VFM31_07975, partial [Nitrososphaeraceae archaeon]|nr:hypothetical protein [Nitrososphaeraceae archaeon]
VIKEYLANQKNKEYLGKILKSEELQIYNEKITTANLKKLFKSYDTEKYIINCQMWSNKYNKAYNKWKDLSQDEEEKDKWKKEILQMIRKK